MDESQFNSRTFADARPMPQPDFELLLALAGLRQFSAPTAQTHVYGAIGARGNNREFRLALLAGDRAPAGHHKRASTQFFEWIESVADEANLAGQRTLNHGILSYLQSARDIDGVSGPDSRHNRSEQSLREA